MPANTTFKRVAYILVLASVYFAAARFGLALQSVNSFVALIWPPTGIAIAALLLIDRDIWPGIAIGAFLVNFSLGASIPETTGIAIGNTLEAITTLAILKRMHFEGKFARLVDSFTFITAVSVAPIVSATIGVASLVIGGSVAFSEFVQTWTSWWTGDLLGALVLVPLVLSWSTPRVYPWTPTEQLERWISIFLSSALSIYLFWYGSSSAFQPSLYPLFVPLAWTALRSGLRWTTLNIFILAVIAETGQLFGKGAFAGYPADIELLMTQLFVGTCAAGFLIIAVMARERRLNLNAMNSNMIKLEAALKRISGEDSAKSEFIAILAHELRNPLAPVLSNLEYMQLDAVAANAEVLRSVGNIHHHVKSMARLLDDLLDISRINNKKYRLERSVIPLAPMITHAVEMSSHAVRARNHAIEVHIPERSVYLDADPMRLEQIIVNILNNAAKFTAVGGKIYLSVIPLENHVAITIRDNGIGIDPDTLQYIFEPFRHFDGYQRETPGLGLGLSLTKRLVELHGGTISVLSAGKNLGSEFVITLPTTAQQPALASTQSEQRIPHGRKHRVLVVDDNKPAADGLAKLLRHFGYETEIAYDGAEALAAIASFRPTVAVLDIGLPGMNGYEVAEKAQLLVGAPALIAVTGYGQSTDKQKARDCGFAFHLTKPVGIRDLTSVLEKIHT